MSATTTVGQIFSSVLNVVIDFAQTIIVDYWPYLIGLAVLSALVAAFGRFLLRLVKGKG